MNAKNNCPKLCIPSLRIISFGKHLGIHLSNIAVDAMGRFFITTFYDDRSSIVIIAAILILKSSVLFFKTR